MRVHDFTRTAKANNFRQPLTSKRRRISARIVCILLAISLLCNSTPAAAQTIVSVADDWSVSFAFWLETSGSLNSLKRLLAGQYLLANRQETQSDRNARVKRLDISPGNVTARIGEVVRFSAIAYGANSDTIAGVNFGWRALGENESPAPIGAAGEFSSLVPGKFTISVSGAGRTAQTVVTVLENAAAARERNVSVTNFSTRNSSSPDAEQVGTTRRSRNSQSETRGVFQKTSFAEASSSTSAPAPVQGSDQYGWNLVNYMTADDPGSQVGDPLGTPLDDGAGNGNFQISAPVVSLAGRGIDVALGLNYNGRLWHKAGSNITYDIDRGWPSAGWSLGFGKMADIGDGGSILIDADGTRHGFNGTATGPLLNSTFNGRTNDGSLIDYACVRNNGVIIFGSATLSNGTRVHYGAAGDGAIYPTHIIDPNGNYINVTYRNNAGPQIETITDTLGRIISFHYDVNNLLTAVTAPAVNGAGTRTLVRLHYQQQLVNASFSGVTTLVRAPSTRWLIDAIYYPATNTGFWFNDADSFLSGYGTIAKVVEQRGMSHSTSGLTDMGTMTPGTMTSQAVYGWQTTASNAPTYTTLTETWAHMDSGAAITSYLVNQNSSPRTTTITLPNGIKNVQYSHNAPGQVTDGLVFKDETYDTDGTTLLARNEVNWVAGDYNSPRPTSNIVTTKQGSNYVTTGTEFTYQTSPSFNQLIEVRNFDFGYVLGGSNTLLRKTVTQYENSTNYTNRHIFNLPKVISVFSGSGVRVSQTEYTYDGSTVEDTPGVIQHLDESDPYAPPITQPGHYITQCTGCPPCSCVPVWIPPSTSSPYKPENAYRGNVTQVKTYADAASLAEATAIVETRTFDMTGNVVEAGTTCCQKSTFDFTTATHYAYPESQTRGSATDPLAQVTTSTTYDFNTGLTLSKTDANGRVSQTTYSSSMRPQTLTLSTGAHTDYAYNDVDMTITESTYLSGHPTDTGLTSQTVSYLNGRNMTRRESALGVGGVVDFIDYSFDNMGRVSQQSEPYRTGDTKQWTTIAYDSLGRTTRVTSADGSVTETYYNATDFDTSDGYQPVRPDAANPTAPGDTRLVRDAWGRERWARTDVQGRLVEVVEPNPSGSGSTATGGLVTTYSYNTIGNLTGIAQGGQTRSFKYDSLGRLTAQKLAEVDATLNDAGSYVGAGTWSEVFTYDLRSNLTSRTDARGVKMVYNYNNDPLNRLQSVSWDTSGFGDTANPISASETISYQYRTKSSGSQLLNITQLASITTNNTSTEAYAYDSEGRITGKTLTLTSRPSYPFVKDYIYDELGRLKDARYPAEYGNGTQPRKLVHYDYDVASRLSGLTVDGQSFASSMVYNAASQITSLNVGQAGPNQIIESYSFTAQTGLLQNQKIARSSAPTNYLVDLSYDYANASGKRSGQITKILNNKNHNKDRGFSYDALGRLVQAKGGPTGTLWTQTYAYDRFGNRTSVTATGSSARLKTDPRADENLVAANRESDQLVAKLGVELPQILGSDVPRSISDSEFRIGLATPAAAPANPQGPPVFTDDPLVPGVTIIKAVHVTELRTAVNQARARAGLSAATWAETVSVGDLVKASHILELRTRLDEARIALGIGAESYTAPTPSIGGTIMATHIQELRASVTEAIVTSITMVADGHTSLSFNAANNRVNTTGWEYDKTGNQTRIQMSGGVWQRFKYDAANRLVQVKTDAGAVISTYTYGDTNERLMVEEAGTRTYYACGGDVEYIETGSSTTPQWSKSYIYLGARLLSRLTPNGAGGELVQYFHPDSIGTRLVSNAQDVTVFESEVLPFGTALNSDPTLSRRLADYDRSPTTGLDNAVNRQYDSQQGRFTQVDPIGMAASDIASPQTLNLYTYSGNDPINQADPDGLFFGKLLKWFKKVLKILAIVSLIVVTILFTGIPVPMWLFDAALWTFTKVLLPLANFMARVPFLGGVIRTGPIGTPQWNPNSRSIFGNSFQGQSQNKCPPDCQDVITLPPVSAGNIYANFSTAWGQVWDGTKAVGRTLWSGYKIGATFFSGYNEQVVPAMTHVRHFGEWLTGIRVVDENSGIYTAGEYTQIAAQTVLTAGLATSEQVALKATTAVRDRVFRWGWQSFKVRGQWLRNKLHFHLGPDPGLMKHHLPYEWKTWYYHAKSRIRRLLGF